MVEPLRHRQTKEAATDMFEPKATASHLDSTLRVSLYESLAHPPTIISTAFTTNIPEPEF